MYTRGRVDHAGAKSLIYICFYDNRIMSNIDPHLCIIEIYFAAVFRHRIYPEICAYLCFVSTFPARGHHAPARARVFQQKKGPHSVCRAAPEADICLFVEGVPVHCIMWPPLRTQKIGRDGFGKVFACINMLELVYPIVSNVHIHIVSYIVVVGSVPT